LIAALSLFGFILYKRCQLLRAGRPDPRLTSVAKRLRDLLTYGILQKRQPRYLWAGILHILIFWGFVVLGLRSLVLVTQGVNLPVFSPLMHTAFGSFYGSLKDLFELIVLLACILAIVRRALLRPDRYRGSNALEAYFVLGLISFLMLTDMFFEGSGLVLAKTPAGSAQWLPVSQLAADWLSSAAPARLQNIHIWSYWLHLTAFFFFLNFLPLGKHFHIITALPNVLLRKMTAGSLKPARWDVGDIEELDSIGVEKVEDLTWKHLLDLYTCTECGRCTDNCPANAVGRPLAPKTLTLNLRDQAYRQYPVFSGSKAPEAETPPLVGGIIAPDVVWSCTTCGACETECPVFIEYIDKIIDLRRHLIETAQNPKTFNQVLMHFEKTGNPFGKPPAKRAAWTEELEGGPVKILQGGEQVEVLFFVDSYGSFDPAAQNIATAVARGLQLAEVDYGILGPLEKDSGHQVRRMGEEGLFQLLLEENLETLQSIKCERIITTDPHAFNTLTNDYPLSVPVLHYTQFFHHLLVSGRLQPRKAVEANDVYTYHDPCYLGRHNGIYADPREILRSVPGLNLVEMQRSHDRSFCCGGADIVLWHEIEGEQLRMAEKRLQMARQAGANVMVTACPFCLIHFEDAVKTAGLESEMRVVDLMQLLLSTLKKVNSSPESKI
jgi:Fe-S oxidoreductase